MMSLPAQRIDNDISSLFNSKLKKDFSNISTQWTTVSMFIKHVDQLFCFLLKKVKINTLSCRIVMDSRKILFFSFLIICTSVFAQTNSDISVSVDKSSGKYTVASKSMKWNFTGSTNHNLTNLQTIKGNDTFGSYTEIKFNWNSGNSYLSTIKWYENKPVVIFSLTLTTSQVKEPEPFPSFTKFPSLMYSYSFKNQVFAPPQFKLVQTSTPWLFFDDARNSFIISPASDFIVSKLTGDGKTLINSGLNEGIIKLPAGFTHKTILVLSKGIKNTWNIWGNALRNMYKRKLPPNDEGAVLKYYGYWTDNGADYYYNYDTTLGYSQTLLALRKKYKEEGIPVGYMQLDSWWYEKSIYDPNGKPEAEHKNRELPFGKWNRYGGLMSYTADTFLFPDGLPAFYKKLELPLVTHNRWIDPRSPYHEKYKISGYAAVDPKFWAHIINYIKNAGVVCYEQDWLNYIYDKSPEMAVNLNIGNEFTDGMANACKKEGLAMQYCMAMPRYFLQGLKYNNLTTIRTSNDRFEPNKWKDFLYTSQLAYECGIYPWCDVFKSGEKGNMILSVLSAGPVGTGDAMGKEDKTNIMKACRNDGVLVKPDVPVLPVDEDYINDSEGSNIPMLGYTYTKHGSIITGYVFAFTNDSSGSRSVNFNPSKLGIKGKTVVYDPLTEELKVVNSGSGFSSLLNNNLYTYYIIAPVISSGIAFLGDAGKIVSTGEKRIHNVEDNNGTLKVIVLFAKGEASVKLEGYSEKSVTSDKGKIKYDSDTHIFNLILPSGGKKEVEVNIK